MSQISIRECVRTVFQPNDDGMDFRDCADERVMDVFIHRDSGDNQTKGCINSMGPGNVPPSRSKRTLRLGFRGSLESFVFAFDPTNYLLSMLCRS